MVCKPLVRYCDVTVLVTRSSQRMHDMRCLVLILALSGPLCAEVLEGRVLGIADGDTLTLLDNI
jgi:hypothetical protein